MTRRRVILTCAVCGGLPFVVLFSYLARLPSTPEGWFTYDTGLAFPETAVVLEHSVDYTQGMVETFASEGTRVFSFRPDRKTVDSWLASAPPWQPAWTPGPLPVWVNPVTVPASVVYSIRGDMGNGDALVIDPADGTVWHFGWDW